MKQTIYHLAYDKDKFSIIVFINIQVVEFLSLINKENLVLVWLVKYFNFYPPNLFGFDQPNLSFKENFGFNDAAIYGGIKDGFLKFTIPLPSQVIITKDICTECFGTGKIHNHPEFNCYSCGGTKLNRQRNALAVNSTVATLYLLLRYLDFAYGEFNNDKNEIKIPQDILIAISAESGVCKSGLGGGFSSEIDNKSKKLFQHFKNEKPDTFIPNSIGGPIVYLEEIHNTMVAFYGHMKGISVSDSESNCEFHASVKEDGRIYLQTIGINSCSVYHTQNGFGNMLDGLTLTCHNIDYYLQELTLFVGLISYYQMVSEID